MKKEILERGSLRVTEESSNTENWGMEVES